MPEKKYKLAESKEKQTGLGQSDTGKGIRFKPDMQLFLTLFKTGKGILGSINLILENIPKKGQMNYSVKQT